MKSTNAHSGDVRSDVLVIGGGLGGIAAAMAAADMGATVALSMAETIPGGQVTTQAVSPLDEHPLIETTGASASYQEFRRRVRAHYGGRDNPGGGWVSRLCFEPRVGHLVIEEMLAPYFDAGRIRMFRSHEPVAVALDPLSGHIMEVEFRGPGGRPEVLSAEVVIDATELGDLLELAGADTIIGSEGSDAFDEPNAVAGPPDPLAEQSCTWVAGLELLDCPSPSSTLRGTPVDSPNASFSLDIAGWDGTVHPYRMFGAARTGLPPFWTYRRVRDAAQLGGRDAIVLNWAANDYVTTGLVAQPAVTRRGARDLTLGFVHWLQTQAPREEGGHGYPELTLAPDITCSSDGFALAPYVRESRRIASRFPVTEHHLAAAPGSEHAPLMADAVGTAWYHADMHARVRHPDPVYAPTSPFQIPARGLVCEAGRGPANLIAGAKNIAATQVAASAYRVHPGEWSIGEAAGVLAAVSVAQGRAPAVIARTNAGVRRLQRRLLKRGTPLIWATDLPSTHPAFMAVTLATLAGGAVGARAEGLELRPDDGVDRVERVALAEVFGLRDLPTAPTWGECAEEALRKSAHTQQSQPTATAKELFDNPLESQ